MSSIIDSRLMSTAYSISTLHQEFLAHVARDAPDIDRALDCCVLLTHAIEQFNSFIACAKDDVAPLVPDPKDEVIISKARVVHRIVADKKLDKEAWLAAIAADAKLAQIELTHLDAKKAYDAAQKPYKLASAWIEIKESKK